MRLCVFEAGRGPRLGVVRRNHIVDVAAIDERLPKDRHAFEAATPEAKAHLGALAEACPNKAVLIRRDVVKMIDEWDVT